MYFKDAYKILEVYIKDLSTSLEHSQPSKPSKLTSQIT